MGETLVAIPAHADDAELNAGGTMAKWAAEGGKVHIVMVTNNCSGKVLPPNGDERAARRLPPAEMTALRHREQDTAASLIGATVHHLGYRQRHYWDGRRVVSIGFSEDAPPHPVAGARKKRLVPLLIAYLEREHVTALADLLVRLKPTLVITQSPLDLDPEHHAVACFVWQAFLARPRKLKCDLWFWTPGSSCQQGLTYPRHGVMMDISEFYEKKLELCRCHASQMTRVRWQMVEQRAARWGSEMGVRYAEPFSIAWFPRPGHPSCPS